MVAGTAEQGCGGDRSSIVGGRPGNDTWKNVLPPTGVGADDGLKGTDGLKNYEAGPFGARLGLRVGGHSRVPRGHGEKRDTNLSNAFLEFPTSLGLHRGLSGDRESQVYPFS